MNTMVENWEQYKDLEYYPDHFCGCPCEGRIKVKSWHKYHGIPRYIRGHCGRKTEINFLLVEEVEAILSGEKEAPFCACRCGGRIKVRPQHKYVGIPEYIRGHNKMPKKAKENLCRLYKDKIYEERYGERVEEILQKHREGAKKWIRMDEAKVNMSKAHLGVPHPHTEEQDKKISESLIKGYASGRIVPAKGMLGKHHTKESNQKNSESHLGKYPSEETRAKLSASSSGENNPNWQGGISNLPYPFEFNEELREFVRRRDSYICQLCSKTQEENVKRLSVHHIDYVKENINLDNLITLCSVCNPKVNFNREYWTEFFQNVVNVNKSLNR